MTIEQVNTLGVLRELIETCKSSRAGYTSAASNSSNHAAKSLFIVLGEQRTAFMRELRELADRFGGTEGLSGEPDGLVEHWTNVKEAAETKDPDEMLAECERGEDATVTAFARALEEERLMPEAREIVARQLESVKKARERITHLREEISGKS